MTAYGTIADSVRAMKEGAFDYLAKGDSDDRLVVIVERAAEKARLRRRVADLEKKVVSHYTFDAMVGHSPALEEAKRKAQQVAPTEATVLLEGPTGAGKELFAQSIHYASRRREKPFVAVNCSAFPSDLLESELFGYKKGAFTGANTDKKGLFEEANGGTLFLDEIGELAGEAQAKLLRALESQEFTKLGDSRPTRVNVRLVAAMIWSVNSSAAGKSTAWKRTRLSMRADRKATLRASRSNLATSSTASSCWARAIAAANWGRSLFLPLSISRRVATSCASLRRKFYTAACWASRPRPDWPWRTVLTRK
jgi:hypothetical protein